MYADIQRVRNVFSWIFGWDPTHPSCRTKENHCAAAGIQNALHFVIINVKRLFILAAVRECECLCDNDTAFFTLFSFSLSLALCLASMSHFVTYIFGMNSYEYCVLFLTSKWIVFDLCTSKMSFYSSIRTKTEGRNFVNERNSAKVFYLLPPNWIYDEEIMWCKMKTKQHASNE